MILFMDINTIIRTHLTAKFAPMSAKVVHTVSSTFVLLTHTRLHLFEHYRQNFSHPNLFDDFLNLWLEAHVKHAVSFI